MEPLKTAEPQYQIQLDVHVEKGPVRLGLTTSHIWRTDPRHLVFLLARYKFCAKMLAGKRSAVEVGCGDGFGSAIVQQVVPEVHGVDFDPVFVANARDVNKERSGLSFEVADFTVQTLDRMFDAAYCLDVIEHIEPIKEDRFVANICRCMGPDGVLVMGTPNVHSGAHASNWSQEGHVNLKDAEGIRALLLRHFANVLVFSMNDEVVHTGFSPMAHYLMAVAVGPRAAV